MTLAFCCSDMSGKHVCPFMQLDASYGNYHAWYAPASALPSSSSLPFRFSALPFSPSLARLCDRRMTELKDNDGKSFTMADYLKIAKRLQGVGAEELNTFSKQVRSLSLSLAPSLCDSVAPFSVPLQPSTMHLLRLPPVSPTVHPFHRLLLPVPAAAGLLLLSFRIRCASDQGGQSVWAVAAPRGRL